MASPAWLGWAFAAVMIALAATSVLCTPGGPMPKTVTGASAPVLDAVLVAAMVGVAGWSSLRLGAAYRARPHAVAADRAVPALNARPAVNATVAPGLAASCQLAMYLTTVYMLVLMR